VTLGSGYSRAIYVALLRLFALVVLSRWIPPLETNERVRTQLLGLAEQWEHLATTYEFVASLERFLLDRQKGTLPVEVEKLPTDEPPI